MKANVMSVVRIGLVAATASGIFSGCSTLNTASEGIGSITDVTSSTTSDDKSAAFVDKRFAAIRAQAARGAGEDLDSLATLRGETDRAAFARFMKERYGDLFTGLEQPRELLVRLDRFRGRNASQRT